MSKSLSYIGFFCSCGERVTAVSTNVGGLAGAFRCPKCFIGFDIDLTFTVQEKDGRSMRVGLPTNRSPDGCVSYSN